MNMIIITAAAIVSLGVYLGLSRVAEAILLLADAIDDHSNWDKFD